MGAHENKSVPLVLLLLPTTSYKAGAFLDAASRLGVDVVIGSERRQALETVSRGHTLVVDFARPEPSVARILRLDRKRALAAVIGVDDESTYVAALAARELKLPHNAPEAVRATRDKGVMRQRLAAAGLGGPGFRLVPLDGDPRRSAEDTDYPCVIKPTHLSAGRGVLRADDADAFVRAFERVKQIVSGKDVRRSHGVATHLLVEDYLPGVEVAVEGLLTEGRLRLLALFDKPDPLEGPTFEETIYVTPSRLPYEVQQSVVRETAAACRALDLSHGPIHAELRIEGGTPTILEVAARTIGGLCARTLRFGTGVALEELVLGHALGLDRHDFERERPAAGVMMLPTRQAGKLLRVNGLAEARAVAGIEELTLTLHRGSRLVPLPEGHRYLGFAFARGSSPADVERALREAWSHLSIEIAAPGVRTAAASEGRPDPRAAPLSRTKVR